MAAGDDDADDGDYRLEDQVGFLLRCAHQRASSIFQEVMAEGGLTPTQFSALVRLRDADEISQNQLGRLTAMDPATIQGVIRRLVERQLIHRRADPGDKRRTLVRLSPAGRRLTDTVVPHGPVVSERTLAPLSPQEKRVFLALLRRLT